MKQKKGKARSLNAKVTSTASSEHFEKEREQEIEREGERDRETRRDR